MMNSAIEKIIMDEKVIQNQVRELGEQISSDYEGETPVLVCILKGAFIFLSDLVRNMSIPVELDFMMVSSYGDEATSSGIVKIKKDIDTDITGRHVIIVEDIVDTGLTLDYLYQYFSNHNPASVKVCAFLDKPEAHQVDLKIDYLGFEIGNEFVVGYGLDYAQNYRNLPYIGILKREIYE